MIIGSFKLRDKIKQNKTNNKKSKKKSKKTSVHVPKQNKATNNNE